MRLVGALATLVASHLAAEEDLATAAIGLQIGPPRKPQVQIVVVGEGALELVIPRHRAPPLRGPPRMTLATTAAIGMESVPAGSQRTSASRARVIITYPSRRMESR